MLLVDIHKGSSDEEYCPFPALIDLGANYNLILRAVTDKLSPEAVKSRKKKNKAKMLLSIIIVNGELLRTTAAIHQMAQMRNSAAMKWSYAINFIIAEFAHYDYIHCIAWLQKQNPVI
jgi:hypothetical protein